MKENNNSYSEYLNRIESEEVKIMRAVLDHIEDKGDYEFEDSSAHNAIIGYFNKNRFHRKMTSEEFDRWKLEETYKDDIKSKYFKKKIKIKESVEAKKEFEIFFRKINRKKPLIFFKRVLRLFS
jgi:hypothetical protein